MFNDTIIKMSTTAIAIGLLSLGETSTTSTGRTIVGDEEIYYHEMTSQNAISFEKFADKPSVLELILSAIRVEDLDIKFLYSIQDFANKQVELDNDFKSALVSLANKVGQRDFTRKRF